MAINGTIAKLSDGTNEYLLASTAYGECSTAAATAAKTVNITGDGSSTVPFTLIKGTSIRVKFTNTNSVANPTLNVNSTGAKAIMRYGTTRPDITNLLSWNAGAVISFTYDGTYWQMENWVNGSVVQETINTNANYPILLKGSTSADMYNGKVGTTQLSGNLVTINPSTGNLNVQKINGVTPVLTDTTYALSMAIDSTDTGCLNITFSAN